MPIPYIQRNTSAPELRDFAADVAEVVGMHINARSRPTLGADPTDPKYFEYAYLNPYQAFSELSTIDEIDLITALNRFTLTEADRSAASASVAWCSAWQKVWKSAGGSSFVLVAQETYDGVLHQFETRDSPFWAAAMISEKQFALFVVIDELVKLVEQYVDPQLLNGLRSMDRETYHRAVKELAVDMHYTMLIYSLTLFCKALAGAISPDYTYMAKALTAQVQDRMTNFGVWLHWMYGPPTIKAQVEEEIGDRDHAGWNAMQEELKVWRATFGAERPLG